jgi:HD superfamily phosphohydrolase YqeK
VTKDGGQISVEFTILLLHDASHEIAGMAAIMHDVTTRFEETQRLRREPEKISAS